MIYFITKYALSSGIREVNACNYHASGDGIYGKSTGDSFSAGYYGKDWHKTKEEAISRAEEMRVAKIASLKKSIAKMEKLIFDKPAA